MPSRHELRQVQQQNWATHNPDGAVSAEVMADIGFTPFEEFHDVVDRGRLDAATLNTVGGEVVAAVEPIIEPVIDLPKPSRAPASRPTRSQRRRRGFSGGPVRGDSEADTGPPAYYQEFAPANWPGADDTFRAGIANARAALAEARNRKS